MGLRSIFAEPLIISSTNRAALSLVLQTPDKGRQFWCRGFKRWCKRRSIRPRYGAIGQPASIAIVERFIRSMKQECTRLLLVPLSIDAMRSEIRLYSRWYNTDRPHMDLAVELPAVTRCGSRSGSSTGGSTCPSSSCVAPRDRHVVVGVRRCSGPVRLHCSRRAEFHSDFPRPCDCRLAQRLRSYRDSAVCPRRSSRWPATVASAGRSTRFSGERSRSFGSEGGKPPRGSSVLVRRRRGGLVLPAAKLRGRAAELLAERLREVAATGEPHAPRDGVHGKLRLAQQPGAAA